MNCQSQWYQDPRHAQNYKIVSSDCNTRNYFYFGRKRHENQIVCQ